MSTIEFDEEHFSHPRGTPITKRDPDMLAAEIAAKHGVRVANMLGKGRFHHLVVARAELYATLRAWGWSYPAIGVFVGRDHTTVILALSSPEKRAARSHQSKVWNATRTREESETVQ